MAEAIKTEYQAEVELIGGHGGVLDVVVDGKKVFSKHESGYKPTPEELVKLMK